MSIKKIKNIQPPFPFEAYSHLVSPIPRKDGGGFLISIPDLPGFIADGETLEEALINAKEAFAAWVSAQADMGRKIPEPTLQDDEPAMSGKYIQRLPKSLHAKLAAFAKKEGVSLNSLALSFIAEGIGRRLSQR